MYTADRYLLYITRFFTAVGMVTNLFLVLRTVPTAIMGPLRTPGCQNTTSFFGLLVFLAVFFWSTGFAALQPTGFIGLFQNP